MSLPPGTEVQAYNWKAPYSPDIAYVNGYMWRASGKPAPGTRSVYKVDIGRAGLAEGREQSCRAGWPTTWAGLSRT
ncbi:hypothetical protein FJY69_00530 [candidate division WOR-3 bacterium]|nr:hypothetical protein [candidate division WOR-3 bacterium]